MADDTRWNPTPPAWTPPVTRVPKPRVLLFEFTHREHRYRCDLLDHGALGVEAQFSLNGELLEGRTFETSTLAALWADERRKVIKTGRD